MNFKSRTFLMVLIFGLMIVGSLYAQTDNRLNGRWTVTQDGIELEYRFNNGNFDEFMMGGPSGRGTYTASNGEITINHTHVHGGLFESIGLSGLESKWYTRNEAIIALRPIFTEWGASESQIIDAVNSMMSNRKYNYSVDANSLILSGTIEGQNILLIFNKK